LVRVARALQACLARQVLKVPQAPLEQQGLKAKGVLMELKVLKGFRD
jgi:hypothetical protein